jgi:hypothetical protein
MGPWYSVNLQEGMIMDFSVHNVPRYDEKTTEGITLTTLLTSFCEENLKHPYVILGVATNDWACHIQVSNAADAATLMEHCEVDHIKESWRF